MEKKAEQLKKDLKLYLEYVQQFEKGELFFSGLEKPEKPKNEHAGTKKAEEPVPVPDKSKEDKLRELALKIDSCRNCPLHRTRIKAVPGEGSVDAPVMFIGEGPGYDEDRQGRPFVGRAGQLLTKIIESIGLKREEVFIGNVVKCHPMKDPQNPQKRGNDRPPSRDEMEACFSYLKEQIEIIKPKVICTLGGCSVQMLVNTTEPIGRLRGRLTEYNGIKLIPTYHPAALLRNDTLKKPVWEDMKLLKTLL